MEINNKYRVFFSNEDDANRAIQTMRQLIIDYGNATVADLTDIMGNVPPIEDMYIGWTDIAGCVVSSPNNYGIVFVDFPKPRRLEPKEDRAGTCNKEVVDHPSHYQSKTGLEAWDVIEAFTSDLNGIEAFDTGNVLKYMCRWKGKNGLEDLKKAKRYLEHLIDHVEKLEKEND